MPSSSIDNCARVSETVPFAACGQVNFPRSSRFANKHSPSPSHHSSLIRSPRFPRNTNTCPENGLSASAVCTIPLSPTKPRRMSVTPATIQIRVPAASPIIAPDTPTPRATMPDRPSRQCESFLWVVQSESCRTSPVRFSFAPLPWHPASRAPPANQAFPDSPVRAAPADTAAARRTIGWHSLHALAPPVLPMRRAPALPQRFDASPPRCEIVAAALYLSLV